MKKYINTFTTIATNFLRLLLFAFIFQSNIQAFKKNVTLNNFKQVKHLPNQHILFSNITHLPILANGDVALPSNAYNFHGGSNASVDPRTGTVSFSLKVASFMYNHTNSTFDLNLSYQSHAAPSQNDRFGLGSEWIWNVGFEKPSTTEVNGHMFTDIVTGSGHALTMSMTRNTAGENIWKSLRHKLHDVFLQGKPGDWTITDASGRKEHLHNGFEDWMQNADGSRIWFYYDDIFPKNNHRHLTYICSHPIKLSDISSTFNACRNNGIHITYSANQIIIYGKQIVKINLKHSSLQQVLIKSIVMPSLASLPSSDPLLIDIGYDEQNNLPWLLNQIHYSTGMSTTFFYNGESSHRLLTHGLPTGFHGGFLPVVTEEITHSGNDSVPDRKLFFYYGLNSKDQHNFTGYQNNTISIPGKDNLIDRPNNYVYHVTVDNGMTQTTTTYNKYHLPLNVKQVIDHSRSVVVSHTMEYLPWKNTTFKHLLPNYSMPQKMTKTIYSVSNDHKVYLQHAFIDTEQKQYDNSGRVVWSCDVFGRQTFIQYCPVTGNKHCIPLKKNQPEGATLVEKIIRLPSLTGKKKSIKSEPDAVEVMFDYAVIRSKLDLKKRVYSREINSGFVQVHRKMSGIIPLNEVMNLKPKAPLPNLKPENMITLTEYRYNQKPEDYDFGQLARMTVFKVKKRAERFSYHLLKLESNPNESMTYHISRIHNIKNHTITVVTSLQSKRIKANMSNKQMSIHQAISLHASNQNIPLSIATYSDTLGTLLQQKTVHDHVAMSMLYDQWQRPIKKTVTPKNGGYPHITTWQYIANVKELAVIETNSEGYQTKVVSAPSGEIVSTWHRFKCNTAAQPSRWIQDASYTYTQTGRLASKSRRMQNDQQNQVNLTTFYGYDALNRPIWEKLPDGQILFTAYDDVHMRVFHYQVGMKQGGGYELYPLLTVSKTNILGKPVQVYTFSLNSQETAKVHALFSKNLIKQLNAFHTKLNNQLNLKSINGADFFNSNGPDGLAQFVDAAIQEKAWLSHTSFEYDGLGRLISKNDGHDTTTHQIWKHGNLVANITPNGNIIHDSFDLSGHRTQRCVQLKYSSICHVLGSRGYDHLGLLTWQKDLYGNTIHYTYDAMHRMIGMQTPKSSSDSISHQLTWCYNDIGVTQMSVDGQIYILYHYDPKTWRLTDREDHISHTHYEYQKGNGLLTHVVQTKPKTLSALSDIHYPEGEQFFYYDQYGHPTRFVDYDGNAFLSKHDALGRVIKTLIKIAKHHNNTLLTKMTYDGFGRVHTKTNGMGMIRIFAYNFAGSLLSTTDYYHRRVLQKLSYQYDTETGNLLSFTRAAHGASATQTYRYDKNNNLTQMHCFDTNDPNHASVLCPRDTNIDDSGLLKSPVILSQFYHFDLWNNIKDVTETVITKKNKTLQKTVHYIYEGDHADAQHTKIFDPWKLNAIDTHWSNQTFSLKPKQLTWDHLGRIVKDIDDNTLHYNALGQMDQFHSKRGKTIHYLYNGAGNQVVEEMMDAKHHLEQAPLYMIYDGSQMIGQQQKDSQGVVHRRVNLNGLAALNDGNIDKWYSHDYKGDVVMTLNQKELLHENVYSPYGMSYDLVNQTNKANQLLWKQNQIGYDGEVTDYATGYQFLGGGYRAYNPVYRRFMSQDSFSPFKKMDGFGFADNNPIMNTDPTGHMSKNFGYAMSAFGIAMSVGLSFVLPVSAWAASTSTIGLIATVASGVVAGVVGTVSGSLQIAATAESHPDKGVRISNTVFGIANGVMGMFMGGASAAEGGILFATQASKLGKIASGLVITSGVNGALSSGIEMVESSVGASSLATKSGYQAALNVLSLTSIVTMGISLITGVAAGFVGFKIPAPKPLYYPQNFSDFDIDAVDPRFYKVVVSDEFNHYHSPRYALIGGRSIHYPKIRFDILSVNDIKFYFNKSQTELIKITIDGHEVTVTEVKKLILQKSKLFRMHVHEPKLMIIWKRSSVFGESSSMKYMIRQQQCYGALLKCAVLGSIVEAAFNKSDEGFFDPEWQTWQQSVYGGWKSVSLN